MEEPIPIEKFMGKMSNKKTSIRENRKEEKELLRKNKHSDHFEKTGDAVQLTDSFSTSTNKKLDSVSLAIRRQLEKDD